MTDYVAMMTADIAALRQLGAQAHRLADEREKALQEAQVKAWYKEAERLSKEAGMWGGRIYTALANRQPGAKFYRGCCAEAAVMAKSVEKRPETYSLDKLKAKGLLGSSFEAGIVIHSRYFHAYFGGHDHDIVGQAWERLLAHATREELKEMLGVDEIMTGEGLVTLA